MNPLASKSRHLATFYLKFQEQGEGYRVKFLDRGIQTHPTGAAGQIISRPSPASKPV